MRNSKPLPELLSPAGSPDALRAAISAGADAVYFGGADFSNRMRAKNFTEAELEESIKLCRLYGVKSYITVNTRVRDIEMADVLSYCRRLYEYGADAIIVADVGIAAQLRRLMPDLELHASTQMSLATPYDAEMLKSCGYNRIVVPRELDRKTLQKIIDDSTLEIEMFAHGAHCVSFSGQCLMSWVMGGRSGNRGECAQPCRLGYKVGGGSNKNPYPLSLKDMMLASHIPEIIGMGVSSLKLEGRQKSADYVYGVTKIYRRLLDERRAADADEIKELDSLFSRDGFTDGYFMHRSENMLGRRPEDAKSAEPEVTEYDLSARKRKVTMKFTCRENEKLSLTMECGGRKAEAYGEMPNVSQGKICVDRDYALRYLKKLGSTPFACDDESISCEIDSGLFCPASALNMLRRDCCEMLEKSISQAERKVFEGEYRHAEASDEKIFSRGRTDVIKIGQFLYPERITEETEKKLDVICVPYYETENVINSGKTDLSKLCAYLPEVVYDDRHTDEILDMLEKAGCKAVMCHTMGQILAADRRKMKIYGSLRLNITNSDAADAYYGMSDNMQVCVASPELNLAAVRDLKCRCGLVIYGRLPLMITERCFISDGKCAKPCKGHGRCIASLSDRKGESFPVISDGECRNVIYNSKKLMMSDRMQKIKNICAQVYLFTDESSGVIENVLDGYEDGMYIDCGGVKRID